ITGVGRSATVRHSVSSQKASRSASDPPPRATMTTSTSGIAASSRSAAAIRGAAWRSWTGTKAHTRRPPQPRRRSPARTGQELLGLEQALGVELAAQALQRGEQVPFARDPELADGEAEGRRGDR